MAALGSTLRGNFEKEVVKARDEAENAARAALATLAVGRDRPFDSMIEEKRALRRSSRARARQLGEGDMNAGMPRLIEEIAYEQWHRMLFARFLAENDLLMHPEGVAVTLQECAELANEEGAEDLWAIATRYAGLMLPGIFRIDDPALQVRFAPEGRHKLEQIVTDMPKAVFTSEDGLGWAYQFWQSKKKDEVNASQRKIGGADIAPVTQLFTENYMVKFLLHNTLGAWWAHRHPNSPLNKTFEYLRYREDGLPAAGTFEDWPDKAAEVTMMDPCGGSGHFVIAAFEMFYRMRMEEEGLSADEAGDAVIRDNVHMLEIDLRCTQIAGFSLALVAWKNGGYRELPIPRIACSGLPVQGQLEDWTALAENDIALKWTLERLYGLFDNALDLGSLIDPAAIPIQDRMFLGDYEQLQTRLTKVIGDEHEQFDPSRRFIGLALSGIAEAWRLLTGKFNLVATNVPYLKRGNQSQKLQDFCEAQHPDAKADLATTFIERCVSLAESAGACALVTPQNWSFLGSYEDFRRHLLAKEEFALICWLGPGAFETISGEVVKPVLLICRNNEPPTGASFRGIDVSDVPTAAGKAEQLRNGVFRSVKQLHQFQNPDCRIMLEDYSKGNLLSKYVDSIKGLTTGDSPRLIRYFWELDYVRPGWEYLQGTVNDSIHFGGREQIFFWCDGEGPMRLLPGARPMSERGWGKNGVLVNQLGSLPVTLYTGNAHDNNTAALIPKDPAHLEALWAFCRSVEFNKSVRSLDKKLNVTNSTLIKIPFDVEHWQSVASKVEPLPKPNSSDPTQWLFDGSPKTAMEPLQTAVARVLGYEWLGQQQDEFTECADEDGIVCIPSVVGEQPASERVRSVLAGAFGDNWSLAKLRHLLSAAGYKGRSLEIWLRDCFFKHQNRLFKNRPFIWHIWDGRKDGFSALVNYHKLDHAKLERLIYTYLGDWINTQRAEQEQGVAGAEGRLVAALELKKKSELILEGEPPYDIYVRWKPMDEQPIGWNPDLNDGVRLNIRPFVTAGVLRSKFTIHWKKDRGKDPDGSERHNDLHFTRDEKEEAWEAAKKAR